MIGLVTLFISPESPVFLYVIKGKTKKAVKGTFIYSKINSVTKSNEFVFLVLQKLRNLSVSDLVIDISVMRKDQNSLQNCSSSSFTSLFTNKDFRLPIFLVCALHIGQQLIGINAVRSFMVIHVML